MSDAWGGAFGESWGESWGSDRRQVGGKRRKERKRRRYQLPDGTHVFGTEEEVSALLQTVEPQAPEPVFVKKVGRKPVVAEGRPVVLEVERFVEPKAPDPVVAFSQTAELEAIAVEAMLKRFRRRRMAALLLL